MVRDKRGDSLPNIAAFVAVSVREELLTYFRRRTLSTAVAEELAHETLVRFLEGGYERATSEARAIVFGIARHVLIDHIRAKRHESQTRAVRPADEDFDPLGDVESDEPTAERILQSREELAAAAAAIEAMPPRVREAFVLARLHGLKHAEIATRMGISTSMVEKHIMDAAARLLHAMKKRELR